MTVTTHTTDFAFLTSTCQYRARCTCGWLRFGPYLNDLTALAAVHDLDDEPKVRREDLKHDYKGENKCGN